MRTLSTEQFTFANVTALKVTGRPGLTRRLVFTLALELLPQFWDDNDPDRLLHAMRILSIDGDLFVEVDGKLRLVAGLRALSPPLPLAQGRASGRVELQLGADLSPELLTALLASAPASPTFALELRGVAEVVSNPLYDHDGYQTTRVGDHGIARAIQNIGVRTLAALHESDQKVCLSVTEWASVRAELG